MGFHLPQTDAGSCERAQILLISEGAAKSITNDHCRWRNATPVIKGGSGGLHRKIHQTPRPALFCACSSNADYFDPVYHESSLASPSVGPQLSAVSCVHRVIH